MDQTKELTMIKTTIAVVTYGSFICLLVFCALGTLLRPNYTSHMSARDIREANEAVWATVIVEDTIARRHAR